MSDIKPYVSKEVYFIYPDEEAPPIGRKILLLTNRDVCVIGTWTPETCKAWHPLLRIKRRVELNKA